MVKEIISQTPEGKGDESPPEAQTLTKEKNNLRKKKMQATESMKINEGRRNQTVKRDTRPNRQRSNSFGSTTKVDISSFRSYLKSEKALQAKRSRDTRSLSSESSISSPAKKRADTVVADIVDVKNQEASQQRKSQQQGLQVSTGAGATVGTTNSPPGVNSLKAKDTQHENYQKTPEKQSTLGVLAPDLRGLTDSS